MSHLDDVRNSLPKPPVNVALHYPDGSVVPVECAYLGWDDDSQTHVWQAINAPDEIPDSLQCDLLPGHTTIQVVSP